MSDLAVRHRALESRLAELPGVVVAFSGGVDSAFLLKVAIDVLGPRAHAVTAVSPTMARAEVADARALGAELGLGDRHHLVDADELAVPGYAANPIDRCALCKTELMSVATPIAAQVGAPIALGTNTDDLGDHRPGIAAASAAGALMPMVEAGLDKAAVRALSRQLGLRTWDKPQLACLSSRFPYGTAITRARLRQVDDFEDGLRALGFRQVRVRFHDAVARLEVEVSELPRLVEPAVRAAVVALGRQLGFTFVALDLAGFTSGSLNQLLGDGLVPLGRRRPGAAPT
ncbi:MAG: ATP-dependent sacrificial sulfur transferase LarE [Myxococcales bacterium]|nr:ATP-dependent sacrificial sulfur transferase LarE [Myxococcales bacterium]